MLGVVLMVVVIVMCGVCVCCSHKGSWCLVNSHCSKLPSHSHMFVSFVFLHNTVVTVHLIVLVFAS